MKTLHHLLTGLVLAAAAAWVPGAAAQSRVEQALPSGPLCATRAPDVAQWQVSYKAQPLPKPAANGAAAAPATAKAPEPDGADYQKIIVKNRTLYHVQWTTGSRFAVDKWCLQDVQVTTLPNAQLPVISTPAERDDYYMDFSKSDFHGFEWISGKNFTGVQSIGGVECMVFKDTLKGQEGETHEAQAVVDYKTRLPVSLQVGEGLTTYQFSPAPSSQLNPPAKIASLADQWRKRLKQARLSSPP
jgi:hypothetical protein